MRGAAAAPPPPLLYRAPVFAREAAEVFRRRRTYVVQFFFLAALLGMLALFWPRGEADAAYAGRTLFSYLAAMELAVAALVAPALTAPGIASEREKETLGLLAIAGISPLRIVAGKALGRLAQVAVLVAISLPLLGALFTVGGLSPREVGTVFVEAIALAALGAGLGSLFSATARRPETATLNAFIMIVAIAAAPPMLARAGLPVPAYYLSPAAWYEALFNPLAATGEVVFRRWWIAPLVHFGLGAAALLAGARALARRGYEPYKGGPSRIVPLRRLILRLRKRGGPLGLGGRCGTEGAARRWRERSVRTVSDGALAILFGAFILVFEIAAPASSRPALRMGTAIVLASAATQLATVLGAAAFARERDQHTLEPLAAAPLDADEFLLGKLLGIGRCVLICAGAVVLHVALGSLRGDVAWAAVLAICGTIPFGLALHAVVGLSLSCHARSTMRATAGALVVAVLLAGLANVGCFFFGLSPPSFVYQVLEGGHTTLQGGPAAAPFAWLAVAVAAALLAAAVAVVAWNHLRARFDALIGRAALDLIELPDTISAQK